MTIDTHITQLAVRVVPRYPRQFYLYANGACPAFDQLMELLTARRIAEPHMRFNGQDIGARTVVEDIRISAPFGTRSGPELADALADAFRELAGRDEAGVRVYIRKEHEMNNEDGGVVLGLPGADMDADHAAVRRLLNEAALAAGLIPQAGSVA